MTYKTTAAKRKYQRDYQREYRLRQISKAKKSTHHSPIENNSEQPINETIENDYQPDTLDTLIIKSDEAKKSLFEKIIETKEVANLDDIPQIEKGNIIEQKLSTENNTPLPNDTSTETKKVKEKGVGSGNYQRKNRTSSNNPPQDKESAKPIKQVDLIASSVNGMVLPIVAIKFHKEYNDLKLSQAQINELALIMPENDLMKPSWLNYFMMLSAFGIGNFMASRDDEQTRERKKLEAEMKLQNSKLQTEMKNIRTDFNLNARQTKPDTHGNEKTN